jgi:hypothetical protein
MTGIKKYNYPLFNKIAKKLRGGGHKVINPAEFFGGKGDRSREEYMRESIKALLNAEEVILLPAWEGSQGAVLEVLIAKELGLRITSYDK